MTCHNHASIMTTPQSLMYLCVLMCLGMKSQLILSKLTPSWVVYTINMQVQMLLRPQLARFWNHFYLKRSDVIGCPDQYPQYRINIKDQVGEIQTLHQA